MPRDFPILDCVAKAEPLLAAGHHIYQKWTCRHCGSRQTMEEADTFFESGTCEACGKVSEIDMCGFAAHLKIRRRA